VDSTSPGGGMTRGSRRPAADSPAHSATTSTGPSRRP
jgi:hypothetical protein